MVADDAGGDSRSMVPMPQVTAIGSLADEFRAYTSLETDMASVQQLIRALLARPSIDDPGEDDPIASALWDTAVIAYGRCFKQGRRKGYVNRIVVPVEHRQVHDWLLGVRDEHVAHLSQNSLGEQSKAVLLLEAVGDHAVQAVAVLYLRLLHPERSAIVGVLSLAVAMEAEFGRAKESAGRRLLDQAKQRPSDEIYAAGSEGRSVRFENG
jgi:hypothetical protein